MIELKEHLTNGKSEQIMKRMTAYSANITGSDSYWYKRRSELEATFEQKDCATIFFTFSYADNHWNDLHKLMPGGFSDNPKVRYQKVLDNPHLVDWYFSYRLDQFLKVIFDGVLKCVWRWHRFEWQSRSSIHAHGAAKFANDPGLISLTAKSYAGLKAQEQLLNKHNSESKKKINNLIFY